MRGRNGLFDLLAGALPEPIPEERAAGEQPVTLADLMAHENTLGQILEGMQALLARISGEVERKQPYFETVSLSPTGATYRLATRGYRHSRLWATATGAITVANQIGSAALTLAAGWNVLDLPDGTELSVVSPQTATTLLLQLTDDPVN